MSADRESVRVYTYWNGCPGIFAEGVGHGEPRIPSQEDCDGHGRRGSRQRGANAAGGTTQAELAGRPARRADLLPRGRRRPLRHGRMGPPHGGDQGRERRRAVRAEGVRGPGLVEPTGHHRRGQQVFLRRGRHARARNQRAAAHPPRRPDAGRLGHRRRLFRLGRRRRAVLPRAYLALSSPARIVQLAGVVQRGTLSAVRRRGGDVQLALGPRHPHRPPAQEFLRIPPRLGLLHPERRRQHGRHHGARPKRGHVVQVRLGHRHGPFVAPIAP